MSKYDVLYVKGCQPLKDGELLNNLKVFQSFSKKYFNWFEVTDQNLKDTLDNLNWNHTKVILCGEFNSSFKDILKEITAKKQESSICKNLTWDFNCEEAEKITGVDLSKQIKTGFISCVDI